MLSTDFSLNQNTYRPSFTSKPTKLNLRSVSEALCNDYFQKQVSPFENSLFYKYLGKNPKSLDSLLKKLYKGKLADYDKVLADSNIDKKHRVLLVDPQVTSRLDELAGYVKDKKIDTKKLSPIELRQGFSDYLGTETVYRGIGSEDGKELIEGFKRQGIYPRFHENKEGVLNSIQYYLSTTAKPVWNVFSKIRDVIGGKQNEFMPVSSIYDVSASVPKGNSPSVVVVRTEVPKLSVIKQRGDFKQRLPIDEDVLIIGDKKYDYKTQREKIESFIPFYIPVKNAKYTIDIKTPDYRWG